MEWRRFDVIDKNSQDKLIRLSKKKRISRENLLLILSTLRIINPNIFEPNHQQHFSIEDLI